MEQDHTETSKRSKFNINSYYVMLNNKMCVLNECFNSILLVCYMFRTSYVHLRGDYIVHVTLYGMFSMLKLQ